jgi:hypothetical protein
MQRVFFLDYLLDYMAQVIPLINTLTLYLSQRNKTILLRYNYSLFLSL